jgi:hypothetical protein
MIAGSVNDDEFIQYSSVVSQWNKMFSPEMLRKKPGNAMFLWRCLNFILRKQTITPYQFQHLR